MRLRTVEKRDEAPPLESALSHSKCTPGRDFGRDGGTAAHFLALWLKAACCGASGPVVSRPFGVLFWQSRSG